MWLIRGIRRRVEKCGSPRDARRVHLALLQFPVPNSYFPRSASFPRKHRGVRRRPAAICVSACSRACLLASWTGWSIGLICSARAFVEHSTKYWISLEFKVKVNFLQWPEANLALKLGVALCKMHTTTIDTTFEYINTSVI